MRFNMEVWKESILASQTRMAMPVMTHPGIALKGWTVLETVSNAAFHADAVIAVAEAYPACASTMIMDLSVEAEAFGAGIRFDDDEVPTVMTRCVHDETTVAQLRVPSLMTGRVGQWIDASRLVAKSSIDRPLFAGCIGPFSLAARLFDVTETMTAVLTEPETIARLVDTCTRFLIEYVKGFKAAGANGVLIAEPVAGVLSEDLCAEYSSKYIRHIVRAVQDENFAVILHNCGDTDPLVGTMASTGAWGLHFGNRGNVAEALEQLPRTTLVFGNIDPVGVFKSGTPISMRSEVLQLLEATERFPNFILSSGCDVPPHVPAANIGAFFEAVQEFNGRKTVR
jgi:uroporphyrinogen decarboxylase